MTRVPPSPVRDAVVGYADRWHRTLPAQHRVTSPLGAWLVLALAAPVATGDESATVEVALGLPASDAFEVAGALLGALPPTVAAAAAFWCRPDLLGDWTPDWPAAVGTGAVPIQAVADAWAREHTLGLIDVFPLELSPQLAFVLCSAIATRVRWQRPFDVGPAFGGWSVPTLVSPRGPGGSGSVVTTAVGDPALWTTPSDDGLDVTSVIADPDVPAAEVMAVAHDLAVAATTDPGSIPGRRSLFDLPLGRAPLWEITETVGPHPRAERVSARLPAWEAQSTWDLLADPVTGFAAAGSGLARHTGTPELAAVQTALGRFGREGFEAAAITAMAGRAAVRMDSGVQREAELRFGHPYAVVATVGGWTTEALGSPWFGMPVFAAWVAEASDPASVVTG